MAITPDELFAALDRLGIAHLTVSHQPLFTVEQSQSLRGSIAGGHTKNLFLRDKKGALFLVTALEDAAIELKSLHRRLGATGRFRGGSSIGSGICVRQTGPVPPVTRHLVGFLRVEARDVTDAELLLAGNPVWEAGGTVEIRELPTS